MAALPFANAAASTPLRRLSASSSLLPVGISLAVLASLAGTIGKQLLRYSETHKQKGNTYVAKVSLIIGLVFNIAVTPILDMLSYMFAPQSLIAPLAGLDIVWNTMIAPFALGERLNKTIIFGVVLIFGGATGTTAFGSHEDKEYDLKKMRDVFTRPIVAVYLGVLLVWLLFNICCLQPRSSVPRGEPWKTGDPVRGLSLGMTAGSLAGNLWCVKAFMELLQASFRDDDSGIWSDWLPWVMLLGAIFFAVSSFWFLARAMQQYQALFMGAVIEGSLIICACVSGMVVYSDLESLSWYQCILYFAALGGVVSGILVVAYGSFRPEKDIEEMEEGDLPTTPIRPPSKNSVSALISPRSPSSTVVSAHDTPLRPNVCGALLDLPFAPNHWSSPTNKKNSGDQSCAQVGDTIGAPAVSTGASQPPSESIEACSEAIGVPLSKNIS